VSTSFSVARYLDAHTRLAGKLDERAFQAGVDLVRRAFDAGKHIITCGNGGSAYAASHYINDMSYDDVFAGQLKAILDAGDLVIAVSGSGNSRNVVKAVEYANQAGAETLAIVGYDGGTLKKIAQHSVWVPSFDMQLCEDVHLMFGHMVMKSLCGSPIEE
jgi:D-sedoheptulose 7-phosphate isomerase